MPNPYREFPTTLGVNPKTGGPVATGKIIRPKAEAKVTKPPTFYSKGKKVKSAIKSRKQALAEIMGE